MNRSLFLSLLIASLVGCSTTVGPVVKDVHTGHDGAIVVESCKLTITPSGFGNVTAYYEDCHTKRASEGPTAGGAEASARSDEKDGSSDG